MYSVIILECVFVHVVRTHKIVFYNVGPCLFMIKYLA